MSHRTGLRLRVTVNRLEDRWVPAVLVNVDATANLHAIDPRVYGVAFASTADLTALNAPTNRYGGNTTSTYNWQLNADNRGSDWYFESLPYASGTPGEMVDTFIQNANNAQAQSLITIPTSGWVANLGPSRTRLSSYSITKYGMQTGNDWQWFPDAGNGIRLSNGQPITTNNPTDANVAVGPSDDSAWVQHLTSKWGTAANGGVRYYILDNEPSIWYSTHRDTHPDGQTMQQEADNLITYAGAVKGQDAGAYVMGPEEWGWTGYFDSGADQQYGAKTGDWGNLPDRKAHGNADYLPWVLQQLKKHDQAAGTRTLDAFTVHFYPQGNETSNTDVSQATQLLRNRSTRALWDPNYVNESWIGQAGPDNGIVDLIPRLRNWADSDYLSGTDIGITEYNWGAEGYMNGATTQADIMGIFGRENLNLANRWTTPAAGSPTYLAMKLWRNYDGQDHGFGDVSAQAVVPNPDQVSAFVSRRSSDGALTVVVINKNLYDPANPGATTPITVNLSHFANTGSAQYWRLSATNPSNQTVAAIAQQGNVAISGNSFTFNAAMESVNMFVISPASQPAPTLQSTQIGDGTAQRSRVGSVTLTFSELVALGQGAIAVQRTGSIGGVPVTIDTSMSTPTQTVAKLTFGGSFVEFGSLIDGRYTLSVAADLVLDTGGRAMAANQTINFHRLFGDADGNGTVNAADFLAFRTAFGGNSATFDFNNNGSVDASDFLAFRSRFGSSV